MLKSLLRPAFPADAINFAGFVLVHCAAIADANCKGELICPFAVIVDSHGRRVLNFECETQEEAVSTGWKSLGDAKSSNVSWAFGREGIYRETDGNGTDVLTVTVWTPQMEVHHSVLQRFGRSPDQAIYFIGSPEVLKHSGDTAEPVERWDRSALERGIASHPQGARWSTWSPQ